MKYGVHFRSADTGRRLQVPRHVADGVGASHVDFYLFDPDEFRGNWVRTHNNSIRRRTGKIRVHGLRPGLKGLGRIMSRRALVGRIHAAVYGQNLFIKYGPFAVHVL